MSDVKDYGSVSDDSNSENTSTGNDLKEGTTVTPFGKVGLNKLRN